MQAHQCVPGVCRVCASWFRASPEVDWGRRALLLRVRRHAHSHGMARVWGRPLIEGAAVEVEQCTPHQEPGKPGSGTCAPTVAASPNDMAAMCSGGASHGLPTRISKSAEAATVQGATCECDQRSYSGLQTQPTPVPASMTAACASIDSADATVWPRFAPSVCQTVGLHAPA